MKQTSIEWFAQKDTELTIEFLEGRLNQIQYSLRKMKCLYEAKEMHKEEIIHAWMASDNELQRIAAEQYYNETYGGNK